MGEKDICRKCKKNLAGKPKNIDFLYKHIRFFVFKNGAECADCKRKEEIRLFKEFGKDLVKKVEGKIVINWKLFCEKEIFRGGTYSENIHDNMLWMLLALNIFSFRSENNYAIFSDTNIPLAPSSIAGWFYFTREEDVIEYAKIKYKNTMYSWEIRHSDKVIKKSDIVKE